MSLYLMMGPDPFSLLKILLQNGRLLIIISYSFKGTLSILQLNMEIFELTEKLEKIINKIINKTPTLLNLNY